jgi:hypothetical protein
VGADFTLFYSAAKLALAGQPAAVYNFADLRRVQKDLFGPQVALPWPYPPTFLLAVLPLALLPYLLALGLWLGLTLTAYLFVVRQAAPSPLTILLTVASPAVFVNVLCGQNGFLSATLLGGGLLLLERRPVEAGVLFGLMTYKPHLAVLVPLALMAGRHWQALAATSATVFSLALLSVLVFGLEIWQAFARQILFSVDMLAERGAPWSKMASVFAAIRLLGGSSALAWGTQILVMILVTWIIVRLWRGQVLPGLKNAALVMGTLLVPPHLFSYDLALLALPIAWLAWEGFQSGWLKGEPEVLIIAWSMPMFLLPLAHSHLKMLASPIVLILMFFMIRRRSRMYSMGLPGSPCK